MFNSSLLDQTFTSGVISIDFTDNCPCFVILKNAKRNFNSDKTKISFRFVTDTYKNIFKTKLENFDWMTVKSTDINIYVNNFCKTLDKIYCESFPP